MKRSFTVQSCLATFLLVIIGQCLWVAAQTNKKKAPPAQQDRGMITKKTPPAEKPQPQPEQTSSAQPQLFIQLGHSQIIKAVAASPDGRFVITGGLDRTARLWDAATGAELKVFSGHTGDVTALAFSPDSRFALSASQDNTARLWDLTTGTQVALFTTSTREARKGLTSVAFSPDGRIVLHGSKKTNAKLWEVKTKKHLHNLKGQMPCNRFFKSPKQQFSAYNTSCNRQ